MILIITFVIIRFRWYQFVLLNYFFPNCFIQIDDTYFKK